MRGAFEDRRAIAVLHNLSRLHDVDLIGDIGDHREIVADEEHADVAGLLQLGDQRENLRLDRDIQRRGGLIRDQQARFVDQRHGDHYPLAHAAGKLVGVTVHGGLGVADTDFAQQFDSALSRPGFRGAAMHQQGLDQLLADAHKRI